MSVGTVTKILEVLSEVKPETVTKDDVITSDGTHLNAREISRRAFVPQIDAERVLTAVSNLSEPKNGMMKEYAEKVGMKNFFVAQPLFPSEHRIQFKLYGTDGSFYEYNLRAETLASIIENR